MLPRGDLFSSFGDSKHAKHLKLHIRFLKMITLCYKISKIINFQQDGCSGVCSVSLDGTALVECS